MDCAWDPALRPPSVEPRVCSGPRGSCCSTGSGRVCLGRGPRLCIPPATRCCPATPGDRQPGRLSRVTRRPCWGSRGAPARRAPSQSPRRGHSERAAVLCGAVAGVGEGRRSRRRVPACVAGRGLWSGRGPGGLRGRGPGGLVTWGAGGPRVRGPGAGGQGSRPGGPDGRGWGTGGPEVRRSGLRRS